MQKNKSDKKKPVENESSTSSDDESESSDSESENSSDSETEYDSEEKSKSSKSSEKWDGKAGRNGTSRQNKGQNKKKKEKLSGIAQEQSVALYVQNIKRKPDMSLGKIASLVKNHLKDKGVRCISAQVIRNRYVDDTVGCKIFVPLRQRDKVIGIKIWPDNVRCREWAGDWDSSGKSISRSFGESDESDELFQGQRPGPGRKYGYRRNQWFNSYRH